jgi:subtilisin family serine protease
VLDFANALHESALTEWAEPNFVMEVQFRQDLRNRQWHLHNTGQNGGTLGEDIRANEAWQVTRGSGNVVIAIIDDGVETSHPGLAPNLLLPGGSNFTGGDPNNPNPSGNDSHGTRCAGVAAGAAAGLIDGAAPSCKILPVKLQTRSITAPCMRRF